MLREHNQPDPGEDIEHKRIGKLAMRNKTADGMNRRTFLATSVVAGATIAISEPVAAQTAGKKTFTILHTNDLHSNFIGMPPQPITRRSL